MTTSFAHDSRALAETYDQLSDSQFESGQRLVEGLGIRAGQRVLDVGCGTGRLARWIAGVVGPTGSVVGIDPLPERVALARTGAPELSFEVGQAEDLGAFGDESFDVVCMSAVFHWVSDKPKALAEIHRVLRKGGLVGATTLPRDLAGAGTIGEALLAVLTSGSYDGRVDLSKLAVTSQGTTTDLIAMILQSGLDLAELRIGRRTRVHSTGAEVVDFLESSSFGNFLRIVPEDLRPTLRRDLAAALEARRRADGVSVRDWGLVFVATRP